MTCRSLFGETGFLMSHHYILVNTKQMTLVAGDLSSLVKYRTIIALYGSELFQMQRVPPIPKEITYKLNGKIRLKNLCVRLSVN